MKIKHETYTIEMTKTESKEAGKYGSEKYYELIDIRTTFPNYRIVVKQTPVKKDPYKHLTYDYMEKFLSIYHEEFLDEFNRRRGIYDGVKQVLAGKDTYIEVRAWFLKKCPEITTFVESVAKRREEEREKRRKEKIEVFKIPETKNAEIPETKNAEIPETKNAEISETKNAEISETKNVE